MNLLSRLLKSITTYITPQKELPYGLDHAILNVQLPPQTMWMNMGYWEQETDLPNACRALLDQVLITAGLFDKNCDPIPGKRINLIDVGFGCGDQTLYLGSSGLVESYIGINVVHSQVELARRRLGQEKRDINKGAKSGQRVQLFHADAANPLSWSPDLRLAVSDHEYASSTSTDLHVQGLQRRRPETWVLALDTLYHFCPSRRPFLEYACTDMQASIMGFDFVLGDSVSVWSQLLLRIICWVTGTPFANFLTRVQYEEMLVGVGYAREKIEWRDISEYVFYGIAGFIGKKDEELRQFRMGVGRFKGAQYAFNWWARSGVVRGVVFAARKS
ncbi:hypothetical protein PHISCL_04121 [Aspergillus sclerotialis]|uniref:Methyltransferase domain-containing protein n=1 Tax=Aspergillus sclerotialis TaxID=2070753 RepID=A0A3A2ZQ00_9EURO|nr:hypothetical protein PHISCL_04121 [Aspergillus sclerotialis]